MLSILGIVVIVGVFVAMVIIFGLRQRSESPVSGRVGLVGEIGEARTDLTPEGRVLVHGEWWNAKANENLPAGTKIKVTATDKMMLKVERAPEE